MARSKARINTEESIFKEEIPTPGKQHFRCSDISDAICAYVNTNINGTTRVDTSISKIGYGFYADAQKLELLVQYLSRSPLRGKRKIITISNIDCILMVTIESPEYEAARLYTDATLHKLVRDAGLLLDNRNGALIIAAKTELCGAGVIYANSRNIFLKILERACGE